MGFFTGMLDRIRGSGVSVVDHHGIRAQLQSSTKFFTRYGWPFLLVQYYGYVNQFLTIVRSQCVKSITSQIK